MTKLNSHQSIIHSRGIKRARVYAMAERYLVESIIEVENENVHKAVGQPMYKYIMTYWNLTDNVALMLLDVARKAKAIPALRRALREKKITPPRASRLVSAINKENAEQLIEFACKHTKNETDFQVRRLNPLAKKPDKYKIISETEVEITVTITKEKFAETQRVQSLLAQKQRPATLSDAFGVGISLYLSTQDPVRKAERAFCPDRMKKTKPSTRVTIKRETNQRVDLTAAEIHAVNIRDKGCCVFVDEHGKRCGCDRWTHIHHIIEVRKGGTNHIDNLITLCSFHHDLVHQLSLPIEGQITWLR